METDREGRREGHEWAGSRTVLDGGGTYDLTSVLVDLRGAIATQPEAVRLAVEARLTSVGRRPVERCGGD